MSQINRSGNEANRRPEQASRAEHNGAVPSEERPTLQEPIPFQADEATYRAIVETQTELICRFLPDGTLTFVNHAYCRHFGASANELIGRNFLHLLPQGEELLVQHYLEQLSTLTPANPVVTQEHRVKTSEGEIRWQQWSNRAIFGADGQLLALQAVGRDITERKQLEIELSRLNERFELAAAAVNCLIYDWDLERGTVERTQGLTSLVGYTPEEAGTAANWWSEQIYPPDLQQIEAPFQASLATASRYCYQYRVRHKQGHYIWVEDQGHVMRNAAGEPIRIVGSTTDITNRKEVEETLQLQARVLESMGEGVVMANEIGQIVFTNPTFDRMFGYERGELLGRHVAILSDLPPDAANQLVNDCIKTLRTHGVWSGEARNRRKDGTSFMAGVYISALYVDANPYWIAVQQDITERKQAEIALRQSEERFRALIEQAPDAIYIANHEGTLLDVNTSACQMLGYTREALIGKTFVDIISPEDVPRLIATKASLLAGETLVGEWTHICKDGTRIPIEISTKILPDGYWQVFARDIRDRKRAEAALRESEERYRILANAVPQMMWIDAADGKPEFFNHRTYEYLTGQIPSVHQDVDWLAFVHPDEVEAVSAARATGLQTGAAYEVETRIRRFDHTYRWHLSRVMPLKNQAGRILCWYGTATDIHDLKQVEAGQRFLSESSSILAASLDYSTTLTNLAQLAVPFLADFCFFDQIGADGKLQRVAWHHVDPTQQAKFAQIQQFVPALDCENHPVAKALRSGTASFVPRVTDEWLQAITTSAEHLQFMRQWQPHSWITVPLLVQQRKLGALTFCLTSSERQYSQGDLQLAEELAHRAALALDNAQLYQQAQDANRIKDEFLAVLSHELRSPLNPILGWSKLLQLKHQDKALLMRGLETIERNAKLQTQLIEDLLDVARILRGKLSLNIHPVDLKSTIEAAMETVRLAADAKAIQISTSFEPVGLVSGDSGRLQQVIWNLLSNAIKFTPANGQIQVQLERVRGVLPASSSLSSYAQITVTDTGKGINPEFLPYIFDYFRQADSSTTRNFGGLGLGLAIVRHIVELHGGTVEAASPGEGQGATFIVRLPLSQESNQRKDIPAASASVLENLPLKDVCILIVDDELDTQELTTFVLQQAGAVVLTASSATEALQTLSQSKVDVLVSDIGMPATDGYMMMRQIRALPEIQSGIPAIALTAYAGEFNRQKALAAGFQRHLAKPVEPDALVAAVTTLIKEFGSL